MGKVIASGIYCGNRITVEAVVEDGTLVVLMNEKEVPDIQKRFDELIKVHGTGHFWKNSCRMQKAGAGCCWLPEFLGFLCGRQASGMELCGSPGCFYARWLPLR